MSRWAMMEIQGISSDNADRVKTPGEPIVLLTQVLSFQNWASDQQRLDESYLQSEEIGDPGWIRRVEVNGVELVKNCSPGGFTNTSGGLE